MFISYFILFIVSLCIAGLFCIGLYIASDGETEIAPDGKERVVWSMVLFHVKQWIANRKIEKVYYTPDMLKALCYDAGVMIPNERFEFNYIPESGVYYLDSFQKEVWMRNAAELKEKMYIETRIHDDGTFEIWKEYVCVRFLSKPIIGCYKCYASFWGSIVYWVMIGVASYLGFIKYDSFVVFPLWFLFVFCLIPFNVMIHKLTEEK